MIEYTYEIKRVDTTSRVMEILFSSTGKPDILISGRLPYEGETVTAVAHMYAPLAYWNELLLSDMVPEVGFTEVVSIPEVTDPISAQPQNLQLIITLEIQQRLDKFAQSKGYDNILLACLYVTSTNQEFKQDADRCVYLRDLTWTKANEILAEIQSGIRPQPNSYLDIESDLPLLQWGLLLNDYM